MKQIFTKGIAQCGIAAERTPLQGTDYFRFTAANTLAKCKAECQKKDQCGGYEMVEEGSSLVCKIWLGLIYNPIDLRYYKRVRHLPPGSLKWHPATDSLKGTNVYGDVHNDAHPWSIKFDNIPFTNYLFANTDMSRWVEMTKAAAVGQHYHNGAREVIRSSTSAKRYNARMYYRSGSAEDPWISLRNHDECPDNKHKCMLYAENNIAYHLGSIGMGADVYIRKTDEEIRLEIDYKKTFGNCRRSTDKGVERGSFKNWGG